MEEITIKDPYGFIYITTNMINGKRYIGQKKFIDGWKNYLGSGKILKESINKYGKISFIRKIVDIAYTEDELHLKEINWISNYNADQSEDYYNIASGGEFGVHLSGENNPMYGRPWWNEDTTKEKINEWKRKLTISSKLIWKNMNIETRKYVLKKSHTLNANNKRIKTTNTNIYKNECSIRMKELWKDEDYRIKNGIAGAKRLHRIWETDESKLKMSNIGKKRWENEDYKKHIMSLTSDLKMKKVYLHDGFEIHNFDSISECGRWIANIKNINIHNARTSVSKIINGKGKTAYGYAISLDPNIQPYKKEKYNIKNKNTSNYKPVVMLDDNFIILCKFINTVEAGEYIGVNRENISRTCKGINKTAGGYQWMYYEDYLKLHNETNEIETVNEAIEAE